MKELDQLLHSILKICALSASQTPAKQDIENLSRHSSSLELWSDLVEVLRITKIDTLVYPSFRKNKLTHLMPSSVNVALFQAYAGSCVKNRMFANRTNEILLALNQKNIVPAIWKGLVLAFDYYPDFGDRTMGDVDFYIPINRKQEAMEVFSQLGFIDNIFLEKGEGVFNGCDDKGVLIDVHFICEFFEGHKDSEVYLMDNQTSLSKHKFYTLEPSAFLALLIEHQEGHRTVDGMNFKFFFDLLFFYRRDGSDLNFDKLSRFLKTNEHWALLHKTNLFLKDLMPDLEIPFLNKAGNIGVAFNIAEVRRSSIFGQLGLLSRYRPWVRLVLCWLGLVKKKFNVSPSIIETLYWVIDRFKYLKNLNLKNGVSLLD